MSDAKYRIPRMAMAVMVLGANGCGDDGDEDPAARIQNLAKNYCKLVYTCEGENWSGPDDPDHEFTTEKECVEEYVDYTTAFVQDLSSKCRNAYLSLYECYVALGCDGDEDKCNAAYQAYVDACEDELSK